MAESFGVEDRGHFYDPVGALRDVVRHVMQVVAAVAIEPPAGNDPRTLKDAIAAVLRATRAADPKHYIRGRHDGYHSIDAWPPAPRPRPTRRCVWTSTAGAGPACRSSSASAFRPPRPRRGSSSGGPPRLGFLPHGVRAPEAGQTVISSIPRPASASPSTPAAATCPSPRA
jgi:glucose-6-phosphate 1-dehydrogenase